VKEFWKLV